MNKEIVFEGKKYISSKRASKLTGYTHDYIGQLCRANKINGHLIGKTRYVDLDALIEYKQTHNTDKSSIKSPYAHSPKLPMVISELTRKTMLFLLIFSMISVMSALSNPRYAESKFDSFAEETYLKISSVGMPDIGKANTLAKEKINTLAEVGRTNLAMVKSIDGIEVPNRLSSWALYTYCKLSNACAKSPAPEKEQPVIAGDKQEQVLTTETEVKTAPESGADIKTQTTPRSIEVSVPQIIVQEKVVERVVEKPVSAPNQVMYVGGVTDEELTDRLNILNNELRKEIASIQGGNSSNTIQTIYRTISQTNKIDQLNGVSLTNTTISGTFSGLTDAHIPDDITASNYLSLADWYATSTSGSVSTLNDVGDVTITSAAAGDILYRNSGNTAWVNLAAGTDGQVLKLASGVPSWAADLQSSGGSGLWATSSDSLLAYPTDTSDVIVIGGSATTTTGGILEVIGSSLFRGAITTYNTLTAPTFTATSTTATSTFSGGLSVAGLNISGSATSTAANGIDITSGCFSINGTCVGGGSGSSPWTDNGAYLSPTSNEYLDVSYYVATSTTDKSYFAGGVNTSGTTGGYSIDNNLILQASSTNWSTLIGQSAGGALLAGGIYNTAVGYQALATATTSDRSTAIGYESLYNNTTGSNTALGYRSMYTNSSGNNNTALGYGSLYYNDTGNNNVATGYYALAYNTANDNVAMGYYALYANTTGASNVAIGRSALTTNVGGNNNTGLGSEALRGNTEGDNNVAIGKSAMYLNTTGTGNAAVGYQSMYANTTSANNSAFGGSTLRYNTTGSGNTAVGSAALYTNITGTNNTAIGMYALRYNQSATSSVAIGYQAGTGVSNTSASQNNVFIGYQSGYGNTTGNNNITLGYMSGDNLSTGSNNIVIGYNVDAPAVDSANTLNIGNLIFGTGIDGTATTLSSGNIGIGTSSPSTFKLQVAGDVGPDADKTYNLGAAGYDWGCLYYDSGTLGTCASDERLKENIAELSFGDDPLSKVASLELHTFNFISDETDTTYNGLIAQEVLGIAPELVTVKDNGYYAVKYGDLQWLVISAIKQVYTNITELAQTVADNVTRIVSNKNEIDEMRARIESLESQIASITSTPANPESTPETSPLSITAPTLTVIGNNPAEISIGASYSDMGVLAVATTTEGSMINPTVRYYLDGVLVNSIQIDTSFAATYQVDYSAEFNGLHATSTREVIVGVGSVATSTPTTETSAEPADTEAPVISMIGDAEIQITVGDTYVDEGATAIDDTDGDITDLITTESTLDTETAGTYTILYNVSDTAGNVAVEVVRTITVITAPEAPQTGSEA